MEQKENTQDTVTIKYKKYSMWTMCKIIFMFMLATTAGNMFAYGTVGLNHVWAKMIHLASDFTALCNACLSSLN